MKTNLKIIGVILLSFVGFTALYGGGALMIDSSGELIHLSVAKLKFSPFKDFFIPGAILFVVLGWGSLLVLPFVLNGTPKATNFLILAGVTISGWVVVQMIMLLEINWLHILYLSIGMMLIMVGFKSASKTVRS
jgi:hypothetical protein